MSAKMRKAWYRSRRNQVIIILVIIFCIIYYLSLHDSLYREPNIDLTRRYIEKKLEQALKLDKGSGCDIPKLDPFAKEVTQFDKDMSEVKCPGTDWVKCYHSECRVVPHILETTKNIVCTYKDILYESDAKYTIGSPTDVYGDEPYILTKSDHVKVRCTGKHKGDILPSKWSGHSIGFRSTATPKKPPAGRENTFNVLIFGFDSTSKNTFIRRMPKSYRVLSEVLGATILNGYNIVGDGTPAALFPILTGKTELELPDVRKRMNEGTLDDMPFIFYKLKEDGYRTAYFEDMPWIGTFQYRFNGFKRQPSDHYLRAFYMEESQSGRKWWSNKNRYCVGDTPQYALMMNITEQFLDLPGKKYCFTFIADITHDDINMISVADDETAAFLTQVSRHVTRDTMVLVMGDHGPRYAKVRDTIQGKLEERLPLMAIRLPDDLKRSRPDAQNNLDMNSEVLTTPHDIYATVMDVLDMRQHWNDYKVKGADLTRGLTLLEQIPRNRSCSEAGVEPHWCSCLAWETLQPSEPTYHKAAEAVVNYINSLTESVRSLCIPRTLTSIVWVSRQRPNAGVLTFVAARDADGYVGKFGDGITTQRDNYQIKLVVGPGRGVYEASLVYNVAEDKFDITTRDISRTNAYNNEPSCISATHPHLNMYCYCNNI
ncbi:uncharacterized protein LOC121738071 isoform X2 [Aricia agestis]|uniref:uncharacterized protein LOC121738071 isoform X2 n=1 Tax=Aricia agestis TaxID=91739 RepID=UPI001C2087EA|nr:uncharacterized protein LOC121738071 isoform X2 [Aricia agestis]